MGNEAWRDRWLGYAGVKLLSEAQKIEIREQQKKYSKLVQETRGEIGNHKKAIVALEQKLKDEIPSIPNATLIHEGCGLKAAIPFGQTPEGGLSGGDRLGYCLFCNCEYLR